MTLNDKWVDWWLEVARGWVTSCKRQNRNCSLIYFVSNQKCIFQLYFTFLLNSSNRGRVWSSRRIWVGAGGWRPDEVLHRAAQRAAAQQRYVVSTAARWLCWVALLPVITSLLLLLPWSDLMWLGSSDSSVAETQTLEKKKHKGEIDLMAAAKMLLLQRIQSLLMTKCFHMAANNDHDNQDHVFFSWFSTFFSYCGDIFFCVRACHNNGVLWLNTVCPLSRLLK